MKKLTFGHSPDSDDAFMYYPLDLPEKIDTEGLHFEQILSDIETLNKKAKEAVYDATAISVAGYPDIADDYAIMASGASMGEGYGPIVVAKEKLSLDELSKSVIAIPGIYTTSFLELELAIGRFSYKVMSFDKIMDAVINDEVDAGLIIHEGQLTYNELGLYNVCDLYEWWSKKTGGLPLPLGVDAVKRSLGADLMKKIARVHRRAISYSLSHRDEALDYASRYSRGLKREDMDRFVGMYVNERTVDMGEEGLKASQLLLDEAYEKGLIRKAVKIDLVRG